MVRASGYLQTLDDFNHIVLKASENGVPVYLRDVAKVQIGPEMRRGIAELNGEGEVAGGVVIPAIRQKRPRSDRRREGQTGNAEK